jgi:hypothetical protein
MTLDWFGAGGLLSGSIAVDPCHVYKTCEGLGCEVGRRRTEKMTKVTKMTKM